MNKQLTPEQRKARLQLGLNIAVVAGIALIVGPFAVTILHGLGALFAIGITVGIAWTGMKFMGVFTLMIANASLKRLKAEAMRNPVETLQTEYVKKQQALDQYKTNIRSFIGQYSAFGDQVKKYVSEGLEDADVYTEQLAKMKSLLKLREQKFSEAQDALADFASTIQRTDKKWKMAVAAAAMNEAAGQMEGDVFDKICIETALDSVQTKLNESFADLDLALLDDDKAKKQVADKKAAQLAAPRGSGRVPGVIDVETVPVSRQKFPVA